ncbi:hypothetical protein GAYE_SCF00G1806 [Galdieria yellowstonensis]|uniref:Palmitoyltransferase n=1 Tax=Galdieria yellowstonensis TaxID=3028027 RepID=A0AAV9I971_9RHOD|nr:hypothetical protein GAYE_SCF00G1806 [Galdieria yellowstonensis]
MPNGRQLVCGMRFLRWTAQYVKEILLQVFLFVDSNVDRTLRKSGPLYVFVCSGLTFSVAAAYFLFLLPVMLNKLSRPLVVVHVTLSLLLLFNILFNYIMCMLTPPGDPPTHKLIAGTEYAGLHLRFCRKCGCIKPPRAHHCSVCQKCVLRMDHHCPWINGCVGFRNYRYFLLFLFYLFLGAVYATATVSYMLVVPGFFIPSFSREAKIAVYIFVLCLSVSISLFLLLGWHLYLVWTSQTTIEFYENREKKRTAAMNGRKFIHEYDVGVYKNLKTIFGPYQHIWQLLLPSWRPLPFDGCMWQTADSHMDVSIV